MGITKKTDPESQEYWRLAGKASKQVALWPKWKRDVNLHSYVTEPRSSVPVDRGHYPKGIIGGLEVALILVSREYAGEVNDKGEPRILHSLRVMQGVYGTAEMIVAVLHDIVENTDWTLDSLRESWEFSDEVMAAVDCLIWRDGESYGEFIGRLRGNLIADRVNQSDVQDSCFFHSV